jgi:carboxyl-terminal processing protease
MRGSLALAGILLAASLLIAAPAPRKKSASTDPVLNREAQLFAQQLLSAVYQVMDLYVHPVLCEDLVYAALAGLYKEARQPIPANLRVRVRQAIGRSVPRPDPMMGFPRTMQGPAQTDQALLNLLRGVRREVGRAKALAGQNPLLLCCQAMGRSLDPYSGIVTAEEQRRTLGVNEECDGFGFDLADDTDAEGLVVGTVQPGGPAQRAGMRPGDRIVRLDGKPAQRAAVLALLNPGNRPTVTTILAPPGGQVVAPTPSRLQKMRLSLRRTGKEHKVVLERRRFHPETVLGVIREYNGSWNYFVDREKGIAHVRLGALGRGTAEELRQVLVDLKEDGMKGLILDLRWCPGGYLNEATDVAGLFVGDGAVATVKKRVGEDVYRSTKASVVGDFAVMVLINGDTSGGAELIAAALQDHKRATVAGQRSRGKASIQQMLSLGVTGVGMKLTFGTFFRPSGKNLHRFPGSTAADDWGVRPDPEWNFRISTDLSQRLRDDWQRQTLRPGTCVRRLPLDQPDADPQRQAALQGLVDVLNRR